MTTPRDIASPIERIAWRDGQTLASRDLGDERRFRDRFRGLHLRYQHKTWGVVEGLRATATGASTVAVSPGCAIDSEGRELLLPTLAEVPIPTHAGAGATMYLAFSQDTVSVSCVPRPDLATLCVGASASAPPEEGRLAWKAVSDVRLGDDVLLARALVAGGRLASAVDMSVQRRAASLRQPRTWSDVTQSGQTGWTDASKALIPEIRAEVDTSDAGFTDAPAYFARVAGASQATVGFILSSSASNFSFGLRSAGQLIPGLTQGPKLDAATVESAGWTIMWFAIALSTRN